MPTFLCKYYIVFNTSIVIKLYQAIKRTIYIYIYIYIYINVLYFYVASTISFQGWFRTLILTANCSGHSIFVQSFNIIGFYVAIKEFYALMVKLIVVLDHYAKNLKVIIFDWSAISIGLSITITINKIVT